MIKLYRGIIIVTNHQVYPSLKAKIFTGVKNSFKKQNKKLSDLIFLFFMKAT